MQPVPQADRPKTLRWLPVRCGDDRAVLIHSTGHQPPPSEVLERSRRFGGVPSITHIGLVSWKSGQETRAEEFIRPAIRGFLGNIPGVLAVVEGNSSSPEGLEDRYDYGFVVTFATTEARDAYLDDPSHRPVAEAISLAAERVVVFDI